MNPPAIGAYALGCANQPAVPGGPPGWTEHLAPFHTLLTKIRQATNRLHELSERMQAHEIRLRKLLERNGPDADPGAGERAIAATRATLGQANATGDRIEARKPRIAQANTEMNRFLNGREWDGDQAQRIEAYIRWLAGAFDAASDETQRIVGELSERVERVGGLVTERTAATPAADADGQQTPWLWWIIAALGLTALGAML